MNPLAFLDVHQLSVGIPMKLVSSFPFEFSSWNALMA